MKQEFLVTEQKDEPKLRVVRDTFRCGDSIKITYIFSMVASEWVIRRRIKEYFGG